MLFPWKQHNCESCHFMRQDSRVALFVLTPLSCSSRYSGSLELLLLWVENTCEASEPWNMAECQPSGCRFLQIVFINTLLLKSCLKHWMTFPSPGFISCHPFSATDLWEHRLDTPSLLRFFIFYNCFVSSLELQIPNSGTSKIYLLGTTFLTSQSVAMESATNSAWSLPCQKERMHWEGRQQLFNHKYLCNLAETRNYMEDNRGRRNSNLYDALLRWLLFGERGIPLSTGLHIRQFQVIISFTWGFIGNNIGVEKHLEFAKPNVPSNATSAFSCCYEIILVEKWIAAILNRIAHLNTAFPMKPIYRQLKLASPSCTFMKTAAPSLPGINAPNSVYCWIHRVYMNRFCKGFAKIKNLLLCTVITNKWKLRTLEIYKSSSQHFTVT